MCKVLKNLWMALLVLSTLIILPVNNTQARLEKVTIGFPVKVLQYAPIYFGLEKGIYAREGIDLNIVIIRPDLLISAVSKGGLDFIVTGGTAVFAAVSGLPMKVLMVFNSKAPFWLVSQKEIKSVTELKGKKIGVIHQGDVQHFYAKSYLRKFGLDPDRDVVFVFGNPSPVAYQTLIAKRIDAAPVSPPFNVMAKMAGFNVLGFVGESVPESNLNGIATVHEKVLKNPKLMKRIVLATLKSLKLFETDKNSAIEHLQREFKLKPNVASESYSDVMKILNIDGMTSVTPEEVVKNVTLLLKESGGNIPPDFNPSKVLELSFLKEAQRELGLTKN